MIFFSNFKKQYFFPFFITLFFITSCTKLDVFEKNIVIPQFNWTENMQANGDFTITDKTALYNIYVVLRHTDAYKYNNIWLNLGLQSPGDTLVTQKVNLSLGSDASGWEGTGISDIWEVRKLINNEPMQFKKSGNYHFNITHAMRDNPLLHVLSIGIRIEKVK